MLFPSATAALTAKKRKGSDDECDMCYILVFPYVLYA